MRALVGLLLPAPREVDRRKHPGVADDERIGLRVHRIAERYHRCAVEGCGDLSDACGEPIDLRGCIHRGEFPSVGRAEVHADLFGRRGRPARPALFASSADAMTTTVAAMPTASVTAASAAPERA